MAIQELLAKIENEELRNALKSEYDSVNQKAGENGRKLFDKDKEISALKEQAAQYDAAFKVLKDAGVDPKDIPAKLEKLGYVKTLENDYKLTKELLETTQKTLREKEAFERSVKVKEAVGRIFAEERKNFKGQDGKDIQVLDRFINAREAELFADVDVSNEALIRERAKSVLTSALADQEAVKKEFGFQGNVAPPVPENNGFNSGSPVNVSELMQKHGPEYAMAAVLAAKKK